MLTRKKIEEIQSKWSFGSSGKAFAICGLCDRANALLDELQRIALKIKGLEEYKCE